MMLGDRDKTAHQAGGADFRGIFVVRFFGFGIKQSLVRHEIVK
jgi:hypothetical protein